MGCDIHLYVEKRADDKSPWVTADTWVEDKYEPGRMEVPYDQRFYSGRSYWLFSILANVRNGHGFAGVKTGEGFVPISEPRGMPDDASAEYKSEVEHWNGDGHSHSHHTVAQLLAYDWTQVTQHQGYVDLQNYFRWKQNGRPENWSGMISGPGIAHPAPEEIDKVVEALCIKPWEAYRNDDDAHDKITATLGQSRPHPLVKWTQPYYESAASFLSETMPKLWRLGDPENVRIVFFFDN